MSKLIQSAINGAVEATVKEVLAVVLYDLKQSQDDGLMLPAAVRRLKATIRDKYGLDVAYLQGLEGPNGPDQSEAGIVEEVAGNWPSFEVWLDWVADKFPEGAALGVPAETLKQWYAEGWDSRRAVEEIKQRKGGQVVRHLRP